MDPQGLRRASDAALRHDAEAQMLARAAVTSRALMLVGTPAAVTLVLLVSEPSLSRRASYVVGVLLADAFAIGSMTAMLRWPTGRSSSRSCSC